MSISDCSMTDIPPVIIFIAREESFAFSLANDDEALALEGIRKIF